MHRRARPILALCTVAREDIYVAGYAFRDEDEAAI